MAAAGKTVRASLEGLESAGGTTRWRPLDDCGSFSFFFFSRLGPGRYRECWLAAPSCVSLGAQFESSVPAYSAVWEGGQRPFDTSTDTERRDGDRDRGSRDSETHGRAGNKEVIIESGRAIM